MTNQKEIIQLAEQITKLMGLVAEIHIEVDQITLKLKDIKINFSAK